MQSTHDDSIAVLISGGLDSAILLGEMLTRHEVVHPLFVRGGMHWEAVELHHLRQFLAAIERPALRPLTVLDVPVGDLDPMHWSMTGRNVPDAKTPDEAVFLPGRNILLLTKPMLWCHVHAVPAIALGILGSNPFPDATPEFFRDLENLINRAVDGHVRIERPFARMYKPEVMRLGRDLPLHLSFSCIAPADERHCGVCNKCQERRLAFRDAGMVDPTMYANPESSTSTVTR